jgi:transcriptional regulator with XRE-family HTH domain
MTPAELRLAIKRLGLTQAQFAKALDLNIATVGRMVQGKWPVKRVVALAVERLLLDLKSEDER